MTLPHGTDRLESDRLVLRRIALDDLPFFTRIHALPEVAQHLYPGGRPRSPAETAAEHGIRRGWFRLAGVPAGSGRSHVGSLGVAARDRQHGSAPAVAPHRTPEIIMATTLATRTIDPSRRSHEREIPPAVVTSANRML